MRNKKNEKAKWQPTKLDLMKWAILVILFILVAFNFKRIESWVIWVFNKAIGFFKECLEGKYTFEQIISWTLLWAIGIGVVVFGGYMLLRKRIIDLISEDTKPWNSQNEGKLNNVFPTRKQQMKLYNHFDVTNYHAPGIVVDYEEVLTISIFGIKVKK